MTICYFSATGNHFYLKHSSTNSGSVTWDVQKIDMGIAICHLMSVTGGEFSIADPQISTDENTEYIATITVNRNHQKETKENE